MTSDTTQPVVIQDDNLSRAWARTFLHVLDHRGKTISPFILTLTGFSERGEPVEDPAMRSALDACLAANHMWDIETVAWTIFPRRMWRIAKGDRHRLYELYIATFPRFQAMNRKANGRGLYFERLIRYGRGPKDGNQLEWLISQYTSRPAVRASMFQASVFDPGRDHVAQAQLGFPCLQHVTFVPESGTLTVNAFYATQQLFDKAYGNWLGLCLLGQFMASEMGLRLARLNCYVGIEKLDRPAKSAPSLQPVVAAARACVSPSEGEGCATG